MPWAYCLVLAAAVVGAGDISVQPSRGDRSELLTWRRSIGLLEKPSRRTVETLERHDLERRFRKDPANALILLERKARESPDPDIVYALAELSWLEGKRLDRKRRDEALDCFVDTVAYAFDYLFDPDLASGRNPSDPRYRFAFDLYNGGLDRLIRAAQSHGKVEPGGAIVLKIHGKELSLRVRLENSPWKADDVDELLLASDFEVSGLSSQTYQYGLGVPLIAVRSGEKTQPAEPATGFLPPLIAFPLTAFLRPNSRLRDQNAGADPRECTLDLVDPVKFPSIGKAPELIPIESDLTTPLAYMFSRTDLNRYRWNGLLRPGAAADRSGLMLIRPFEPRKIPVVMVHGLASSPLAWIPMLNELLRDSRIQSRYQFLLYLYPTGVPIPPAAEGLRESLLNVQREFDPNRTDPDFERMVLIGHSMGGVLSHAMAVSSGNRFWELNTSRPFDEIVGPPQVLEELRQYEFFEPLPFVKRVIFLATPHRGSEISRGVVGRVSSRLIDDSDHLTNLLYTLVKENPDAFDRRRFRKLPTSIDTLEPNAPVLLALLAMTPNPNTVFNSIIGVLRPGPVASSSDGVVSYQSAHLEGVESERRVSSDHGVQKDPEAIQEVRRILLKHLETKAEAPAELRISAPR